MAWEKLPENYTDASWDGLRKYIMVNNDDGTVSFQDVTAYTNRENSFFGAKDANRMNEAMNRLMDFVEGGTLPYEADLTGYFTIPAGVEAGSPSMQTLLINNPNAESKRVVVVRNAYGIQASGNASIELTIPANASETILVFSGEFGLVHDREDLYHSRSITYDRQVGDIHVYKIDTCGVIRVDSRPKDVAL